MRIVIHQPYFLPWLGYFSKLAHCDLFVVLDDVLFRKRHFIDRTRIVNMHGELQWIGVPVGQNLGVLCRDIPYREPGHAARLLRTIEHSYAKADHYDAEFPPLSDMIRRAFLENATLVGIDLALIRALFQHITNRQIPILLSSDLDAPADPTERILSICRQAKATEIVVGTGRSLDVHDWSSITNSGVVLLRQDYLNIHPLYKQIRRQRLSFASGLSVVDALLNAGRLDVATFIGDSQYCPLRVSTVPRVEASAS